MKICYYKSSENNFGDNLNPYIFNHFYPNYEELNNNIIVFFIGTILYDDFLTSNNINHSKNKIKIVLGTGIRFINSPIKLDSTWNVRFLRGPLSSLALMKNAYTYITDPAYLIRKLPIYENNKTRTKKYKISIMPHLRSLDKIDWDDLCTEYEVNFISPVDDVESIILKILESEMLITEAMHGAIIADALRVPWKRFKYCSHFYESDLVSEFKWADWLFSMGLVSKVSYLDYNPILREIDKRKKLLFIKKIRKNIIANSFSNLINYGDYQLSEDIILGSKMDRLMQEITASYQYIKSF
jgi:hypothetical protein